jgi:hypothetical protein
MLAMNCGLRTPRAGLVVVQFDKDASQTRD